MGKYKYWRGCQRNYIRFYVYEQVQMPLSAEHFGEEITSLFHWCLCNIFPLFGIWNFPPTSE